MPALVADVVAPVDVLLVELGEQAEASRRPEAALEIADGGFDRALLARRRRRARMRVEAEVATQMQKASIPNHGVELAAGDDRAQVVVDALARHTAQPLQRAYMPLEERLKGQ